MKAWKAAEKQAAKLIGGKRIVRGSDFSQELPDVAHPMYAVEVKYRKELPVKFKTAVEQAKRKGKRWLLTIQPEKTEPVVVCDGELFLEIVQPGSSYVPSAIQGEFVPALIYDALLQAISYEFNLGKVPVLFIKEHGQHGMYAVMKKADFDGLHVHA